MGRQSEALEVTIEALDVQPIDAALVALCRLAARQMDAAEGDPSTLLSAIYLSLLRNLRRLGPAQTAEISTLAEMRARRPRPQPRAKVRRGPDVG